MPRKYRKSYSRPGYKSCGTMVYSDAKKALAIAKSVKRLLNVEIKNHDVQLNAQSVTDSAIITQLSNVPRGDTTNNRDGSQCKMIGYTFNLFMTQNTSATGATLVRIMLVLDKQTNQLLYNIGDLLEDGTVRDNIISPRNLDNMKRFQVLYDRVFHLSNSGSQSASIKKYFKREIVIRFDAAVGDITDLTSNSLTFVMISSEATNVPALTFFGRLRFVDN